MPKAYTAIAHTVKKLASTGASTTTSAPAALSHDWLSWQIPSLRSLIMSGPSVFALAVAGLIVTLSTVYVVPGQVPGTWRIWQLRTKRRGAMDACVSYWNRRVRNVLQLGAQTTAPNAPNASVKCTTIRRFYEWCSYLSIAVFAVRIPRNKADVNLLTGKSSSNLSITNFCIAQSAVSLPGAQEACTMPNPKC